MLLSPAVFVANDRFTFPANRPAIDIRGFNFFYDTFRAREEINLSIFEQRITALTGASGSGKSTLLRAINRLHYKTDDARGEGQILFAGENVLRSHDLVSFIGGIRGKR